MSTSWRNEITPGNVITWVTMLITAGAIWGTLKDNVEDNTEANDRQDVQIELLREAITELKVLAAENNANTKAMRESIERIEARTERRFQLQQQR